MNVKHLAAKIFTPGLKRFSNLHKGKTCYIFGDGPSIKWFNLSEFSNHPAICCGQIPFHKDFHKLDVKYILITEPWLFVPKLFQPNITYLHQLVHIANEYKNLIVSTPEKEFFVSLSNRFALTGKNIHYVYRGLPQIRNKTDALLGNFDLFGGSFHAALSLAYYMGFKKAYLIGFDGWTIQPARALRWYELGPGEFFEPTNFALDFLRALRPEIDIYTISKDGESCNVKNISYESFTGKAPKYSENHELLTNRHLNILATFPEYKIFSNKIVETK
ncbi:hypothetical protein [Polynucleobacter sp. MWH-HuK1]|uniref:hypothetical protein n=1 Tax=Polynucleobacter sp. MWH-HuK1 TaxID=1743158 RepID=UPI001C0CEB52|nr:hypothetical protein [Polynucleobacter sp. MWH-HuK1]MBU3564449.1 hypothetical protein [Polynucleobacter sp. MWH-HuK1]